MHWDKRNQKIIQKVKGLTSFSRFYLWMPLYLLAVLLMLPGYFLWGKGECVMWFIPQNNCAAEIIIQIWLGNLLTLLTSSLARQTIKGPTFWMRAVNRHTLPHQRAEEQMHNERVQHYLRPQLLLAMAFQDSKSFTGFQTEAIKEGTFISSLLCVLPSMQQQSQYSCSTQGLQHLCHKGPCW